MGDPTIDQFGVRTSFLDAAAATADQTIIAAIAGSKIVVDAIWITNGVAAATVKIMSNTTQIMAVAALPIGGNYFSDNIKIKTATGEALKVTTTGAAAVTGITVRWHTEPV